MINNSQRVSRVARHLLFEVLLIPIAPIRIFTLQSFSRSCAREWQLRRRSVSNLSRAAAHNESSHFTL